MTKFPIKTVGGKICGWIQVEDNGDKKALDTAGKILGYYRANSNVTTDVSGRLIARGDVVSSFIKVDI